MAKWEVEVGGFVSTFNKKEDDFVDRFRHRKLIVYADTEEHAKIKAEEKFIDLCQQKPGNMCDEANIDLIKKVK